MCGAAGPGDRHRPAEEEGDPVAIHLARIDEDPPDRGKCRRELRERERATERDYAAEHSHDHDGTDRPHLVGYDRRHTEVPLPTDRAYDDGGGRYKTEPSRPRIGRGVRLMRQHRRKETGILL